MLVKTIYNGWRVIAFRTPSGTYVKGFNTSYQANMQAAKARANGYKCYVAGTGPFYVRVTG